MKLNRFLSITCLTLLLSACANLQNNSKYEQQLQAGVEAFNKTEYEKAYQAWLPLAQDGYGKAQSNIAAIYLSGNGRGQNFFLAYVWIRLAEQNGDTGTQGILRISKGRLTADELMEAETVIQNCLVTNYKDCR